MLELTFTGKISNKDELSSAWDDVIMRIEKEMSANPIEKHFVPLKVSVLNFEVKKLLAFRMIIPLLRETTSSGKGEPKNSPEEWVQTADGKVVGKIDSKKVFLGGYS